jgi:hypothetical protein
VEVLGGIVVISEIVHMKVHGVEWMDRGVIVVMEMAETLETTMEIMICSIIASTMTILDVNGTLEMDLIILEMEISMISIVTHLAEWAILVTTMETVVTMVMAMEMEMAMETL